MTDIYYNCANMALLMPKSFNFCGDRLGRKLPAFIHHHAIERCSLESSVCDLKTVHGGILYSSLLVTLCTIIQARLSFLRSLKVIRHVAGDTVSEATALALNTARVYNITACIGFLSNLEPPADTQLS